MQLKVENSVNICVVDEVKCVHEARYKNWPCFFFFLHYCIYSLCSHYKTFFKAIKILNWKKKKEKRFFSKNSGITLLWLFLQGRWKRGAFEIMWEETKQKFLVALKHSEEIECSVCLDNVLSKPTTPKRKLAVLPKCGPSIVHIMYQELVSWFPNL
jgi:hypothetical protein